MIISFGNVNISFRKALMALAFIAPALSAVPAYAATPSGAPAAAVHSISKGGSFAKKKYNIKGDWKSVQENGQTLIRFSDDFKTKNGPDLKIFLSPQSLGEVNGKTATNGALLLGKLKSNKGGQDYVLPAGVSLTQFQSVLVHCEAFSVLWGGGAL